MSTKKEHLLFEAAEKIKLAAADRDLDLNDPAHEYTLWCALPGGMQYSGSYAGDSNAAWADGRRHPQQYRVYVAKGPVGGFGIMEVER